jgi:hypothetical protein
MNLHAEQLISIGQWNLNSYSLPTVLQAMEVRVSYSGPGAGMGEFTPGMNLTLGGGGYPGPPGHQQLEFFGCFFLLVLKI